VIFMMFLHFYASFLWWHISFVFSSFRFPMWIVPTTNWLIFLRMDSWVEILFLLFFRYSFDSTTNLDSIVWIFTWMILFYRWVCLLIMGTPRMTWSFLPMTVCLLRFVEIYCFIQTSSEFLCKCSILFICLLIDI
jgi:hypothetical protein